ncbi:protein cornichon homolog 4-like isoform X1 [Mizuhopecten yessoensis]|uniref:protein cornichon homolog 4-like isoform X1 n=1 Tax=Mizuhopecten yessoensis TaxID=6573 RepID=UPI000B45A828|nr:protein cornichon homolog 4-like isoform X1 [Mizuhopecten yessoensis]
MGIDSLLFIFSVIDEGALLFLVVYFVITLSDLECDYLNATSCCSKLNKWVLPELIAQSVLAFFLLVTGHWILFLMYTPVTAWMVYKYVTKPSGNIGLYDPTEIHNRHQLKTYLKENLIKLGSHLIFFFVFLYWMIISLLTNEATGAFGSQAALLANLPDVQDAQEVTDRLDG